jgi:hypothetical protein
MRPVTGGSPTRHTSRSPAARQFFARALCSGAVPAEVTICRVPVYPRVLDELIPSALPGRH